MKILRKHGIRLKNSKKGSYIMEAAIVMPVVILVTITAVLIIMFFYSQMSERCQIHIALREEAGRLAGQTDYIGEKNVYADMSTYMSRAENTVYAEKKLVMKHSGVLASKGIFTVKASCFAVDGTDYIRRRMLAEDVFYE